MVDAFVSLAGHTVYAPSLRDRACVIDVGANHGTFGKAISALRPQATVHAVEANPRLIDELQRLDYASVRHVAVIDEERPVRLELASNDESSSILTLPGTSSIGATRVDIACVAGQSMEALLSEFPGTLDLVKVDIEGAEVSALLTLKPATLSRIGQISVEFHRHECFQFGLQQETRDAIESLMGHGFLALGFEESDIDVLLLNRDLLAISVMQAARWKLSAALFRHRAILRRRTKDALRPTAQRVRSVRPVRGGQTR